MTVDTTKLRGLALAATPGPWEATGWKAKRMDGSDLYADNIVDSPTGLVAETGESEREVADAAFIAAANPQAVCELIDGLTTAFDAIEYTLRRIGTDAELAYHMVFTEAFERLVRAYAALSGNDADLIRKEIAHRTGALPQSRCAADREFIADGGRI